MYRSYTADALMDINNNIAENLGGIQIVKRFSDIISPEAEEDKNPEDVINHFKDKINGDTKYELI